MNFDDYRYEPRKTGELEKNMEGKKTAHLRYHGGKKLKDV